MTTTFSAFLTSYTKRCWTLILREYVSLTPISFSYPLYNNKSNSRRKGRSKEIFDFIDKLSPFPFNQTSSITENMFLELVS